MLNGNINIGGGGDETTLPWWNEPNENSNCFENITFSFFYYEAEDITLKTILKSRVSLRKKSWLMADRVRSFFIKLTSESKYLGPFEIWSSWTNDLHTQFYYPLFIPCSAMLTCLRPRAVSKTSGTVFPNTNLRVNNIYLLHLKNHALH